MTRFAYAVLLATLQLAAIGAAAESRQSATELLHSAQAGIAYGAAALRAAGIDSGKRSHKPFLASLRETSRALAEAADGFGKKIPGYFRTLGDTRRRVEELKLTFEKSGIRNRDVVEGVKSAANAIEVLHKNFGREAARLEKGGPLTEDEKRHFAKLKKQRESIVSKLGALRDSSKADAASVKLVRNLDDLIANASRAAAADATAASYVDLLLLVDPLEGEWKGLSAYATPASKEAWLALDADFGRLEELHRAALQTGTEPDWKLIGRSIEVPAEFETGSIELPAPEIEQALAAIETLAPAPSGDDAIGSYWDADEDVLDWDVAALDEAGDILGFGGAGDRASSDLTANDAGTEG